MRTYATWSILSSAVNLAGLLQDMMAGAGFLLRQCTNVSMHVLAAIFVMKAARLVLSRDTPQDRHLQTLLQSIRALSIIFMQLGAFSLFSASLTAMEAAISWPGLISVFATVFGLTTVLRMMALEYVMKRYPVERSALLQMLSQLQHGDPSLVPWVDRIALYIVGGYMMIAHDLPDSDDAEEEAPENKAHHAVEAPADNEFEFSRSHERSFSIFMDSLRDAAGATMISGIATLLHACAQGQIQGWGTLKWVAPLLDVGELAIQATCMLSALGCFSRVITSEGRDVALVMSGISSKRGLTVLFNRLRSVQTGVVLVGLSAKVAALVMVKQTPAAPAQAGFVSAISAIPFKMYLKGSSFFEFVAANLAG